MAKGDSEFQGEVTAHQEPFLVDKKFTIDGKVYARFEIEALIRQCYGYIADIEAKLDPRAKVRVVSKNYGRFKVAFRDLYNRTCEKVEDEDLVARAGGILREGDHFLGIDTAKEYIHYLEVKLGFHQIDPQYRATLRF